MTLPFLGGGDSARVHLAGLSPAVGNRVRMVTCVWENGARARARVHKLRRIPSGDGRRGIGCYPSPCLADCLSLSSVFEAGTTRQRCTLLGCRHGCDSTWLDMVLSC